MYEIHIVARVYDTDKPIDRFLASRVVAAAEEAIAKLDGEIELSELDYYGDDGTSDDEPPIRCWCHAPASFALPPTDASPHPGIWSPVCHEHVDADGYESLQDLADREELDEKLGLS